MRWVKRRPTFFEWIHSRDNWHNWFAWHPVVINEEWVWLEWIQRKGTFRVPPLPGVGHCHWNWEYQNIKELTHDRIT